MLVSVSIMYKRIQTAVFPVHLCHSAGWTNSADDRDADLLEHDVTMLASVIPNNIACGFKLHAMILKASILAIWAPSPIWKVEQVHKRNHNILEVMF